MADVSEALSLADAIVRFLHGRNGSLGNTAWALLHRTGLSSRPPRRLHSNPNRAWVTRQARPLVWLLNDAPSMRFLMHDRDSKFAASFDQIFVSEGFEIIRTSFRASKANAAAERWVRSVRQECLDQLLILNHRHLVLVLEESTRYYNTDRPHQGLSQQTPIRLSRPRHGVVRCRDVLGGILSDYYRNAA